MTAGTIIESQLLESNTNNYLCAFFSDGIRTGIAYADISTGDFSATEIENYEAICEISRLAPAEILITETQEAFSNRDLPIFVTRLRPTIFKFENARKTLLDHFNSTTLKPFGIENLPLAVSAAGAIISYLNESHFGGAENLNRLTSYDFREYMILDPNTVRSLEIFQSYAGKSLLSVIDLTLTPLGGRLLRRWLRQPLLDISEIFRRQEHLGWFMDNVLERDAVREILFQIKDLERLSSRAKANYISAYELRALGKSLELIPKLKQILQKDNVRFGQLIAHLPSCEKSAKLVQCG